MKFINKFTLTGLLFISLSQQSNAIDTQVSAPKESTSEIESYDALLFGGKLNRPQLIALSQQEMKATEGAVAPLVAIGIMAGSRFIAQRYVTQSMARSMVSSAGSNFSRNGASGNWGVMAATRNQARNIAGRNGIREFHPGSGARCTHYHTSSRNGAHVWYGRPR